MSVPCPGLSLYVWCSQLLCANGITAQTNLAAGCFHNKLNITNQAATLSQNCINNYATSEHSGLTRFCHCRLALSGPALNVTSLWSPDTFISVFRILNAAWPNFFLPSFLPSLLTAYALCYSAPNIQLVSQMVSYSWSRSHVWAPSYSQSQKLVITQLRHPLIFVKFPVFL
jgi:hypothetical protein